MPFITAQAFHPQAQLAMGLASIPLGGSKPLYTFQLQSGQGGNWSALGGPWSAKNACLAMKWMKAHLDPYSIVYVFRWGNDFNYEMTLQLGHLPNSLPDVNLSHLNSC